MSSLACALGSIRDAYYRGVPGDQVGGVFHRILDKICGCDSARLTPERPQPIVAAPFQCRDHFFAARKVLMASFQVLHLCRALRRFLPQFLFGAVAALGALASTAPGSAPAGS